MAVETSIGARAAALGHSVEVQQDGKRFRLVCSCGVSTAISWKRKTTFDYMTEHVSAVVRVALREGQPPEDEPGLGRAYPSS